MNTIIYIRVSTGKQEASVEMQRQKCEAYCQMMGYEVEDVMIDENISGGIELFERPEGSLIPSMIETGQVNNIVTHKLDRLFRNALNGLETIQYFNKYGVTFSVIDMGGSILDTKSPMGKMMMTMMLALGELEKETTRDRVKKALNHRKENLKVYSGKIPFGFKAEGKDLIPIKKEMEVVKTIYKLKGLKRSYRDISNTVGVTLSKVHRIANEPMYERFL